MIFNSFEFLFAYLPLVCALYFVLNRWVSHRAGRMFLTAASFFFYAWWDARFVALLLASVAFNFAAGRLSRNRSWLIAGIAGNLAGLVYFKYAGFFFGITGIVLPLGISFFTFTQIAYLVDVYRGEVDPAKYGFFDYALFVSYFPHLLAGPILHHGEMLPQFVNAERAKFNIARFAPGIALLSAGLAKKVLIADSLSPYVATGFSNIGPDIGFAQAWLAALAYTAQIYFDFSGYTDMARGVSKILNIELPINFNSPYQARNLQEFWQRWHITLSRFLRDYLFFPMGGARRPYAATIITFAIAGLWHGANWTFIVWGVLNGIGVVLVRLLPFSLPSVAARALTFVSVTMLWVWFRAANVSDAWRMTKAISGANGIALPALPEQAWLLAAALLIAWLLPNTQKLFDRPALTPAWCVALGVLLAISVASLQHASEFLYFNF